MLHTRGRSAMLHTRPRSAMLHARPSARLASAALLSVLGCSARLRTPLQHIWHTQSCAVFAAVHLKPTSFFSPLRQAAGRFATLY